MDKFSYKNTPLGKAFTKAQSTPPPPIPSPNPPTSDSVGVFSSADDKDVVTRRYVSSFIANNIGGKGYLQYDKATNKVRFQLEVPNREGKKEVVNTGWFKPRTAGDDTTASNKIAATVGRAVTKAGRGKKLTVEEEREYKEAIGQIGNDLINFTEYILGSSKPKPKPEA